MAELFNDKKTGLILPKYIRAKMAEKKPMTPMEFKSKQREQNYERLKQLYKIAKPSPEQVKEMNDIRTEAEKKYVEFLEMGSDVMNEALVKTIKILENVK